MHAIAAIPCWPGTGTTSDGLVVTETFDSVVGGGLVASETKGEVVAVTLGGGTGLETTKDNVSNALTLNQELVIGMQRNTF